MQIKSSYVSLNNFKTVRSSGKVSEVRACNSVIQSDRNSYGYVVLDSINMASRDGNHFITKANILDLWYEYLNFYKGLKVLL